MTKLLNLTNFYSECQIRKDEIESQIAAVDGRLSKAKPGKIRIVKNSDGIQYFVRMDPKEKCGKYIRKADKRTISEYLQKRYDSCIADMLKTEKECLQDFLTKTDSIQEDIIACYTDIPEKERNLVIPVNIPDDEYAKRWLEIPYIRKEISEEFRDHQSDKGEYMRSKSELKIANTLFKLGIPYKYECQLNLKNGVIVHPDFTVLNVRERKIYYWEHRGRMDDLDYARNTVKRHKIYMKNGIFPGINLIITEEDSIDTLSNWEVNAVIEKYLL